jgi:hypothetical protein
MSTTNSASHSADLALTRRVTAGERAAFDALFDRYADRIYALASRRVEDLDAVRELTERMLERVFSEIAQYTGEVCLDWWVLGRCERALSGLQAQRESVPRAEGRTATGG